MKLRRYEAMFLFDTAVTREWPAIEQEVKRLCDRIGAELLVCVKFDERRLAFEIKRRKRGTYALAYFDAQPDKLVDMERDAQLSDVILRMLAVRAENLTEERLAELRAHKADTPLSPAGDGRRHDEERPYSDRPYSDRPRWRGSEGHGGRESDAPGQGDAAAEPESVSAGPTD